MKKVTAFSITTDGVLLTYKQDGNEITAIIDPFLFCTYLCGLKMIQGRKETIRKEVIVNYLNEWITWRDFVISSQVHNIYTLENLEDILETHIDTEILKGVYYSISNHGFALN